jgi:hypothetical protein
MQNKPDRVVFIVLCFLCFAVCSFAQTVVIIRHAEKPEKGKNLNCQGLNRSLKLPAVLYSKFGIPGSIYVPSLDNNESTGHARMFQTVIPLAAKYNLKINSRYGEMDTATLAKEIRGKKGFVLVVWQHSIIPSIVRALGVQGFKMHWGDNDYDSIWIITFQKGIAKISFDKEGLAPSTSCPE